MFCCPRPESEPTAPSAGKKFATQGLDRRRSKGTGTPSHMHQKIASTEITLSCRTVQGEGIRLGFIVTFLLDKQSEYNLPKCIFTASHCPLFTLKVSDAMKVLF